MSRVGVMPVDVPTGVDVKIEDRRVTAKGKFGELSLMLVDEINLAREGNKLIVSPKNETKRARALWGTSRSLLANIVEGVDQGFSVALEIIGVGYRATIDGKELVLQLGYSHEIRYQMPDGITITSERPTHIMVSGADRQMVGQVAAEIRAYRKPEPYKGKGIRYHGEYVIRKEGKKK